MRSKLLACAAIALCAMGSAHAAVVNPAPVAYGPDNGMASITPTGVLSVGSFYLGPFITATGFYFVNAPATLIPVPLTGQTGQFDVINFTNGTITNTTTNAQTTFTVGTGAIDFYATSTLGGTAHVLSNTATVDSEAAFPKIGDPSSFILGFADPVASPQTSAYLTVTLSNPRPSSVPEPSALAGLLTGLVMLAGLAAFNARAGRRS